MYKTSYLIFNRNEEEVINQERQKNIILFLICLIYMTGYTLSNMQTALAYKGDLWMVGKDGDLGMTAVYNNYIPEVLETVVCEINKESKKKPYDDIATFDIRTPSNWSISDFEGVINKEIYPLIDVAIKLENETGVNAVYLVAVGATETLWGKKLVGNYNYFNWSTNGARYYNFNSIDEFCNYSIERYKDAFTDTAFYNRLSKSDSITIGVVNSKYAINSDGTVNKCWGDVVSEIVDKLYERHAEMITE